MNLIRAWSTLCWLSFRRLLWSTTTLMLAMPLLGVAMLMTRFGPRLQLRDPGEAFVLFGEEFVIRIFTLALLPLCALAYATSSIGGDREDRTLLFLLVRPIPRWSILLAKMSATLPLVLGISIGAFYVYCLPAGPAGEAAFRLFLPAVVSMAAAYVGLFHLFAVVFRHSTIIALIYSLFMEALLGNMPGVIKRVAVSFYGRSMMYRLGEPWGLEEATVFQSVSADVGLAALWAIAVGSALAAMFYFQRREYHDLS